MKIVNIVGVFVLLVALQTNAKIAESIEDAYMKQAPHALMELAEQSAERINFTTPFEVVIPLKSAIQINPWNSFLAFGVNPQTKNPFIIINQDWFSALPAAQQEFLLVRALLFLKLGLKSFASQIFPYIFLLFWFLLGFLTYYLLALTRLAAYQWWVRFLVSWGLLILLNVLVLTKVNQAIAGHLARSYDANINKKAIAVTGDKEAAVAVFKAMDTEIKAAVARGETFWKPYENLFEENIQKLEK